MSNNNKKLPDFFINAFYESKFRDSLFVVKASGDVVEDSKSLDNLLCDIRELTMHGIKVLLIYGGGREQRTAAQGGRVRLTALPGGRERLTAPSGGSPRCRAKPALKSALRAASDRECAVGRARASATAHCTSATQASSLAKASAGAGSLA